MMHTPAPTPIEAATRVRLIGSWHQPPALATAVSLACMLPSPIPVWTGVRQYGMDRKIGTVRLRYRARTLTARLVYGRGHDYNTKYEYEWAECLTIRDVDLPPGYFLGFSASTGDLTDYHEIVSVKVRAEQGSHPDQVPPEVARLWTGGDREPQIQSRSEAAPTPERIAAETEAEARGLGGAAGDRSSSSDNPAQQDAAPAAPPAKDQAQDPAPSAAPPVARNQAAEGSKAAAATEAPAAPPTQSEMIGEYTPTVERHASTMKLTPICVLPLLLGRDQRHCAQHTRDC